MTDAMRLLGALSLLSACVDGMTEAVPADQASTAGPARYLRIEFNTGSGATTRATEPKGGDTGDGEETGQDDENKITSAAIFIYDSQDGVNGDEDTKVSVITFDEKELGPYTGGTVTSAAKDVTDLGLSMDKEYHVIAVANYETDTETDYGSLTTLRAVRDNICKPAWLDDYTGFLMSSERDATLSISSSNSKANPDVATVYVERMAARVDCKADDFNIDGGVEVEDRTGRVKLTGAVLVNNLTSGSYLLKRVAEDEGKDVDYLGKEEIDNTVTDPKSPENTATNYVIDPWTNLKDGTAVSEISNGNYQLEYGTYFPGYALSTETVTVDNDVVYTQEDPRYWGTLATLPSVTIDDYYRIGYTMENTTYKDYTSKAYATGVVFGATFYPESETVKADFYASDEFSYDYSTPGTFFKWNGTLYATLEDVMAAAYPSGSTPEFTSDKFKTQITSCSSWENLETFAETLREDDPTGYRAYLEEKIEDAEANETVFPTDKNYLTWEGFMNDVCGYKLVTDDGGNTVTGVSLDNFNDSSTPSTRAILAQLSYNALSTYENGKCYYTWWIRHCNDDDPETNGVMEYAIVRNNIYKLDVTSVYTIGGDIPKEGIQLDVKVKDWEYGAAGTFNF